MSDQQHHDKSTASTAGQSQALANPYYLDHRRIQAPGQGCTNDDGDAPCSLTVSWGRAMSLLDPMWNVVGISDVSPVFSNIANEWATLISQATEPCIVGK